MKRLNIGIPNVESNNLHSNNLLAFIEMAYGDEVGTSCFEKREVISEQVCQELRPRRSTLKKFKTGEANDMKTHYLGRH